MLLFAVWTVLEDAGFWANLRHYNPIIDDEAKRTFALPESWWLIALMPFGMCRRFWRRNECWVSNNRFTAIAARF
ncbi:MAG: hypothetical protein LBU24_05600 [Methanocalculaceae archaeon]|nr:hypothetical protein [Methanocalculaceae archaeon]